MSKTFIYTARTQDGKKQSGFIQAENQERVAAILSEQSLIPTQIKEHSRAVKPGFFGFMKSRVNQDLIIFTRNLSTLYRAGVPILRALSIIKIGEVGGYFNKTIEKIKDNVRLGRSLSESLSELPGIFPPVYSASVAAGEQAGKLDKILDSLGIMLEKDLELSRRIKSSIRYPIAVICAIAMAFIVLFTFVIPRFVDFYSKMGAELPLPTKMLIWVNHLISDYWFFTVALIVVLSYSIKTLYSSPRGRHFIDYKLLKVPVFGELIIKGSIARFSYIFQILISSGIPIVQSLEMLAGVIKNSQLSKEILSMADSFRGGKELTTGPGELIFFPEMARQMIRVGLESGSLDDMLGEIANHYGKEVDYKSRQLTVILEPILTVILGVFMLIIALAIFLPMWNLIQVFRG